MQFDHDTPQDKRPVGKMRVHHRVAARLKAVVKNLGIKPKKKEPRE